MRAGVAFPGTPTMATGRDASISPPASSDVLVNSLDSSCADADAHLKLFLLVRGVKDFIRRSDFAKYHYSFSTVERFATLLGAYQFIEFSGRVCCIQRETYDD